MITRGPRDVQPRLPIDLRQVLNERRLSVNCYQPVFLFRKNGRKLPNVPEPEDPWQAIFRREGEVGVVRTTVGDDLRAAIERGLAEIEDAPGGLRAAMARTEQAVQDLMEAIHACKN